MTATNSEVALGKLPPGALATPGWLERVIAVLLLFVFSVALPVNWFDQGEGRTSGGSVTQLVFLFFLGCICLALMGNWSVVGQAARREPLLPALLALAVLSSVWSANPSQTFQLTAVICVTYLTGLYFAVRFSIRELLALSSWALFAAALASFLLIFGFPEGRDSDGDWSGVFANRNSLARLATVSALIFVLHARNSKSQLFWFACAGMSAVQVLGSGSATSLGGLLGLAFLSIGLRGFRGKRTLYGATALMMIATFTTLFIVTAANFEFALGLLGRESTLTGRLPLWRHSIEFGVSHKPWLGHGWGAFWAEGTGRDFEIVLRSRFVPPHAHNALVDAWLHAGPIAAALLGAIYARGLFWGARAIRVDNSPSGLFQPLMISAAVIYSISEAGLIARNSLFILFVVAVTAAAGNKGQQRRFDESFSVDQVSHHRDNEPAHSGAPAR